MLNGRGSSGSFKGVVPDCKSHRETPYSGCSIDAPIPKFQGAPVSGATLALAAVRMTLRLVGCAVCALANRVRREAEAQPTCGAGLRPVAAPFCSSSSATRARLSGRSLALRLTLLWWEGLTCKRINSSPKCLGTDRILDRRPEPAFFQVLSSLSTCASLLDYCCSGSSR